MTKAERTKKFIIEQAAPIYNEKGVAGTNVDDVLEATKLTKGAIYSHFKNKDDLSMQVTDYLLEKICQGIEQVIQKQTTAKGKIFAYLDFNKKPLNTYIKGGCPIFNMAVESDDNNSSIKSRISEILSVSQKNFASILRQGIKNGEFSSALDPDAYAFKMFAAVEGAIIMCRAMNDERPMQGLIKSLKNELESYEL
ncbi:TetR/AcrR family transcriptional regulator [Chitinophaga filiformis]|uniref:TetR/AcrR family transcriptional regulator n=1 Tax=Chitinophaga filiformis TaxID=104663 RepID=UPI001F3CD788|nr:TetR/AcrR family transcriptional regulator [Chitinophaga filiformis]MCF6407779.1 TetR/AcrR family transcriptional regulator [Chitinophaga filiformis]